MMGRRLFAVVLLGSMVTATNQFQTGSSSPYTYDQVGNLTSDAEATYAYDPFSMLREKD